MWFFGICYQKKRAFKFLWKNCFRWCCNWNLSIPEKKPNHSQRDLQRQQVKLLWFSAPGIRVKSTCNHHRKKRPNFFFRNFIPFGKAKLAMNGAQLKEISWRLCRPKCIKSTEFLYQSKKSTEFIHILEFRDQFAKLPSFQRTLYSSQ